METFLIRALQLILSLSILVVLHELGHFTFARIFKVRVEKFYVFFNPNFSILRAKKINGKWQYRLFSKNTPANERPKVDADGDVMINAKGKPLMESIPLEELPEDDWRKYPDNTEWGIGWLPLGGYCKIAGMVDESMDKTQLLSEPQPWEYRSRSVWQRLPIIIGGVLVNFILAMVIYSAVLFTWGQEYIPTQNVRYGLQFSSLLRENGFQNGDNILKIDGKPIDNYSDAIDRIFYKNAKKATILRNSKIIEINIDHNINLRSVLKKNEPNIMSIRFPFVIDEVSGGSPASSANLQSGDSITGINGKSVFIFQDIASKLDSAKNTTITVDFVRLGKPMTASVHLDQAGKLGVSVRPVNKFLTTKRIEYGFLASIPAGINLGWETLSNYVKSLKFLFTKEGSQQIGGFGTIGKLFPKVWDWQIFWTMTAFISVVLAFMNFLPIPALDGGYVLFLLYEMITGKKPNDKFLEYAQTVGMILLFGLLIYANGNDIFKALFK